MSLTTSPFIRSDRRGRRPSSAAAAGWFGVAAAAITLVAGSASGQCTSTKITAVSAASGDSFGRSIAAGFADGAGVLALVGAPFDDTAQGSGAGSVAIRTRGDGTRPQLTLLSPSDLEVNAAFGTAVAFVDPYVIVGATGITAPSGDRTGAAYIFERTPEGWLGKGRVIPSWATHNASAGRAVDITTADGGWAIVGAPNTDFDGNSAVPGDQNMQAGGAALYHRVSGNWNYVHNVTDHDAAGSGAGQHLGRSVAISGNVAVVGAPDGQAPGKPAQSGYVKLLRRSGGSWPVSGPARFSAPDAQSSARFGSSVATDGDFVLISAPGHDSTAAQTLSVGAVNDAGCVYVYRWNGATSAWDLDGRLFADDAAPGMQLGDRVRMTPHYALVSSVQADRVYGFRRRGAGDWVQEFALRAPAGATSAFAQDFAMANNDILVGDPDDDRPGLTNAGAVHDFLMFSTFSGYDSCSGARILTAPGTFTGCTTAATLDGATVCGLQAPNGSGPDVWYKWTPDCSGYVTLTTAGSDFDTILSVHTDCPNGQTTHTHVCNDDYPGQGLTSRSTYYAIAGNTNWIRVSGYNGAFGNYTLAFQYDSAPANDTCGAPIPVSSGQSYTFANCRATDTGPITSCGSITRDLWYSITVPAAGTLTLDTCGSSFRPAVAVYGGIGCPGMFSPELGCAGHTPGPATCANGGAAANRTLLSVHLPGAFGYMIRIGGDGDLDPIGDGVLRVHFAADCPCDWNYSGAVSVQDIFDFLASYFNDGGDFNGNGVRSVQDIFDFLACYFAGCP